MARGPVARATIRRDLVRVGRWADPMYRIARDPSGGIALVSLSLIVGLAVFGPLVVHWRPNAIRPGDVLLGPSADHLFGTDQSGRDQFARIAAAIPLALEMTIASTGIALFVGAVLGIFAGSAGGATERLVMWLTDMFLAMPPLLLAIVVTGVFGQGVRNTILAISLIYMPRFVRIARGSTLAVRGQPFTEAARLSGTGGLRLMVRHIVPNVLAPLVVMTGLTLSSALLAASALSFLGLGVRPPDADLGSMLAAAESLMSLAPWLVVCPSIVLVLMIVGFNMLGDAVGKVIDPRIGPDQARAGV